MLWIGKEPHLVRDAAEQALLDAYKKQEAKDAE